MIGLNKVDFMDSLGFGVLVSLLKVVCLSGDLVFYGLCLSVVEILSLIYLDVVFSCEEMKEVVMVCFLVDVLV